MLDKYTKTCNNEAHVTAGGGDGFGGVGGGGSGGVSVGRGVGGVGENMVKYPVARGQEEPRCDKCWPVW